MSANFIAYPMNSLSLESSFDQERTFFNAASVLYFFEMNSVTDLVALSAKLVWESQSEE